LYSYIRKFFFKPLFNFFFKDRVFLNWLKFVFLASILVIIITIISFIQLSYSLPSIKVLENYKPVQMAKIISADGKPIKELYVEKRDVINIAKVPEDLRKALIFMEDRKFFDHPGIDIWGILRAVSVGLTGGSTQGASTLTQQLARNMYSDIGFEKSFVRKIKEAITAYNIENIYTKSEIMELYLNSVFFGHRAYGVQQASKYYFGKDVKELNLNECATLVGILPAPNAYSPKKNINTAIGYSADFYNSGNSINYVHQNIFLENLNYADSSEKSIILTKIDGKISEEIILSDILFLNSELDTVDIKFSKNIINNNSISATYDNQEEKLIVNLATDQKIKYYRFRVKGLSKMSSNGIGSGYAQKAGFVELNNSSRALNRKKLVLSIMSEQNYIDKKSYYFNSLMPLRLSSAQKKRYGLASYFAEDVRSELLKYKQSLSHDKINYIFPEFISKKTVLKKWLEKNYKMILDINENKFDLYKDGLRVYSTLDTRVQKFVSEVFQEEMKKNQKDLYWIYSRNENKGLLDSIINISKNRKINELEIFYKRNFASSIQSKIVEDEIQKWRQFGKNDDEILNIIDKAKNKGERFIDSNQNGKWDIGEKFDDGNRQYNNGERYTDANNNGQYDPGEIFIDKKNGKYDSEGIIVTKVSSEIDRLIKGSIDSLNYESDFILDMLKNQKTVPNYLRKEFLIQGSVVVLDVKTGNIIAMIGGRQESEYIDFFNRSSKALRQPGSVFKPFVYMTGLKNYDNEHQPFSANYQIQNQKFSIIDGDRDYQPENFNGKVGGEQTLRQGLRESTNLVAVRLVSKIEDGPNKVKDTAENFGITSSLYPGEAIALGASSVYPLEMTSAYSSIANDGTLMTPNYIYKIENSLGRLLDKIEPEENYAEDNEALIYLIRDMMKDVIKDGTGKSIREKYGFYAPVAGKTGTTNNFTDAWFIGFTPQVAIGVWVGMDNPAVSIKKYGSRAALPVFAKSIKKIYDFGEYSLGNATRELDEDMDWKKPSKGITTKKICNESMRIANKYCSNKAEVQNEFFLDNYIPYDKCNIKSHLSRYK